MDTPTTSTPGREGSADAAGYACPVCGAAEYKIHTEHNHICGPCFREWAVGYSCAGCSVQFTDPLRFGRGRHNDEMRDAMGEKKL